MEQPPIMTDTVNKQKMKLEALEQAIRDYDVIQGGDSAKSLIDWLESTTSFIYDAEEADEPTPPTTPVQGYREEMAAINPDGTVETERDTINRLVKNRDELGRQAERYQESLKEIRSMTAWAKDEHRQDVCKQVYDEANQALSQTDIQPRGVRIEDLGLTALQIERRDRARQAPSQPNCREAYTCPNCMNLIEVADAQKAGMRCPSCATRDIVPLKVIDDPGINSTEDQPSTEEEDTDA